MTQPVLSHLERHGPRQDLLAILAGDDPPHREGAAITNPLDFIVDGHAVVARPQKISMEGVTQPPFHGPAGGHQRLAKYLTAENAGKAQVFTVTLKMIVPDGGQIQQIDQFSGYFQHACSCCDAQEQYPLLNLRRVFYLSRSHLATVNPGVWAEPLSPAPAFPWQTGRSPQSPARRLRVTRSGLSHPNPPALPATGPLSQPGVETPRSGSRGF